MNSEERHEMEQNELVKALARIKSANRRKIAAGVGLAVLVFAVVFFIRYMNHLTAANDADRWVRLQSAADKESLKSLMDLYRGKEAGTVAKMKYARILLTADGLQKLPTTDAKTRLAAANSIEEAKKLFLELTTELTKDQTLAQEAWIDAAKAEEALIAVPKSETERNTSRGDFDRAISYLESAAKIAPESEASKKIVADIEVKKKKKADIVAFYTELQSSLYLAPISDIPPIKDFGSPVIPLNAPEAPKSKESLPKADDKQPELKAPDAPKADVKPKEQPDLKAPAAPKTDAKAKEQPGELKAPPPPPITDGDPKANEKK